MTTLINLIFKFNDIEKQYGDVCERDYSSKL